MAGVGGVRITGLMKVEAQLNAELQGIKVRSGTGLVRFAMRVRREMESIPPFTPVRKKKGGTLRASWRAPLSWSGGSYYITMGFTVAYARFVHEFDDANTNWSRRGSGGHWFELALQRNLPLLRNDIIGGSSYGNLLKEIF